MILDLLRSHSPRIPFVTEDKVLEVLVVVDLPDNIVKALGCNGAVGRSILERTDGHSLT